MIESYHESPRVDNASQHPVFSPVDYDLLDWSTAPTATPTPSAPVVIDVIDGGKAKRPHRHLDGLDDPKIQARRARVKSAKIRQANKQRDLEIADALNFGMSQRATAKACGVSHKIVRGVAARLRPDGTLRMFCEE